MKSSSPIKIFLLATIVIFVAIFFQWLPQRVSADTPTITNITLSPDLDVSWFDSYTVTSTITGEPTSVSMEVAGLNQDGGIYWNYYASGTPVYATHTLTMTDADDDNVWTSSVIRPDDIYPEIFFAPSDITWYNTPDDIIIRRANYHIFHFSNPFIMEASSTFFIEFYATPNSTINSANLSVYLVKKDKDITFFQSDWRNSADVELVGTKNRNDTFHHTHVIDKSSHHLIALYTNDDGTVGNKNLDISDDFWIILYNTSPNNNRGWNLKYHNSALCDNNLGWYRGNQAGWSTIAQSGCPDSHIHMARRGDPSDGISVTTTANYTDNDPVIANEKFYFEPFPNQAPNHTSFITPLAGAVYDSDTIEIYWNTSTDPNDDPVTYNISYYTDSGTTTLATATTTNKLTWDVSALPDGSYGLKGETCDDADTPLCTEFYLTANFTLDKADPLYTLSDISIISDNASTTAAKAGDTITLTFTASGDIAPTLDVDFYSGGEAITNEITSSSLANVWTVNYTVSAEDTDGTIDYVITADNLDFEYSSSTLMVVDVTAPTAVVASPDAGTYDTAQNISLSATDSNQIRYTTDNAEPGCSSGTLYTDAISVSTPTTIKAIACDALENSTAIASFTYSFAYSVNYTAGTGGQITGNTSQTITRGENASAVTAVPNIDYYFKNWSDGLTANPRTDNNILSNLSVTANFDLNPTNGAAPDLGPSGIGPGVVDQILGMEKTADLGQITAGGVNYLTYINSLADFSIPDNITDESLSFSIKINKLDIPGEKVTFTLYPHEQTYTLKLTEIVAIDLNNDNAKDLSITFAHIWQNRIELTIKPFSAINDKNITPAFPQICPSDKFTRDLRLNMTGDDVRALQQYLNKNNFPLTKMGPGSSGQETDFFGQLTQKALTNFQKSRRITADYGTFDFITREYLGCANPTPLIKSTVFFRDLKIGAIGEDVRALQKYLNSQNFILTTDGPGALGQETDFFGELTRAALIKFQKAKNINSAVGYFGPITRGVINR